MRKLPRISGKKLSRFFIKQGYAIDHQTGSHLILRHVQPPYRRLTIPLHKEIAPKTLLSILKQAGLTRDDFFDLY